MDSSYFIAIFLFLFILVSIIFLWRSQAVKYASAVNNLIITFLAGFAIAISSYESLQCAGLECLGVDLIVMFVAIILGFQAFIIVLGFLLKIFFKISILDKLLKILYLIFYGLLILGLFFLAAGETSQSNYY